MAKRSTKDRILDAAEELFALNGSSGASLRAITQRAKVNLAAVHYHFGSKDRLLEAVLARRLLPLNAERIRRLETYQKEAGRKKVRLEYVIEAMVGPALRLSRNKNKGGRIFMRLLGRLVLEPDARIQNLLTGQFEAVLGKFMPSLTVALPHLSPKGFFWRLHFLVGSMAHTMADSERIRLISGGVCDPDDTEGTVQCLVTFLCGGLRAK
tara:strand:+ start:1167 stop:1796 length:630 start_codon:yes stop_codon:yes gene_type:complete